MTTSDVIMIKTESLRGTEKFEGLSLETMEELYYALKMMMPEVEETMHMRRVARVERTGN